MKRYSPCLLLPALLTGCLAGDDPPELGEVTEEVLTRDHRNPSVAGSAHTIASSSIVELAVSLTAGRRVVFETRGRSAGSDPVLHLLAPVSANGAVTEVAQNDDGAGDYNARLSFTPATSGTYLLIMRASWKGKGGTAELLRDGSPMWTALPFGGGFQRFEGLRANEELTTVPMPSGIGGHKLYLVDDSGRIFERHQTAANLSVTRRFTTALPVAVAMVGPTWPDVQSGPVRLVRNDRRLPGHDPDGDLLGTELEAAIGTCSRPTDVVGNFSCSRATDMRDTDGDGLRDDIELLGKVASAPYQFLPRWGADPRHKDLFLEVDFLAADNVEPTLQFQPNRLREMATAFGDPETSPLFRLANAQTLRNPDLEPGIRLHFDVGYNPTDPADATLYGNWGGHNRVPPVCSGSTCGRADASQVWTSQMHVNRRGVFHYLGGTPGSGGQAPPHSVANAIPLMSGGTAAHETGHALGLGHNGPYDGEPIDANCKPTYPSLMSYSYLDAGWRRFSDGYGLASINNVALTERNAVNPSSSKGALFLDHMEAFYGYNVDHAAGHIDWNRDGVYSTSPVRAYANNSGAGCEFTKYNVVKASSRSPRSPALVRLGAMTMMLSIDDDDTLAFEYTLGDLSCPAPAAEGCGQKPSRWWFGESWNQNIDAVDAHRITEGGEAKLLIVYRKGGDLYESVFDPSSFGFTTPRLLATSVPVIDEHSLAGDGTTVYLAYKGSGGRPMLKVRAAGVWADDELVRDNNGTLLGVMGNGVSPALLEAGATGNRTLYAVFPAATNLRLYTFDPVSRRFTRSAWNLSEEASIGKAAMAWVPTPAGAPLPGRMYLFSMKPHSNNAARTIVRERMLLAERQTDGTFAIRFGVEGDHQNSWLYGYGLDLLFEAGVDTNVRLLLARKDLEDDGSEAPRNLELRPKADGIVDYPQRNWNDWEVLRVGLCRTLVSAGGTGLTCPAWQW